jgi:presequence protease
MFKIENFTVGSTIGEYLITRVLPLDSVAGQFVHLEHQRLGTRHIHIACADENNAFAVMFPTVPQDSTGIAHILEHVVLAGSERFPMRDPFFSMLPRTLSTFMNAYTWPDRTSYPFSTRNEKDYYNLLTVYLDAAFFPTIAHETFLQEGWRFEFEDETNPETPLQFKGVVFNEMKGEMADVRSIAFFALGRALFPELTYANNSGGDPKVIPDLTHDQLVAFHARHYHPSNAYFYTYGDLPLAPRLAEIESHVMSRFQKLDIDTSIPLQANFVAPVKLEVAVPLAKTEDVSKNTQVIVAWKTALVTDSFQFLALKVLSRVLLSNDASPLRKALIDSGLGSALADVNGLRPGYREMVFTTGLKGVRPDDVAQVQDLILATLKQIVSDGVPARMVDATIHQLELNSREVSNSGSPFAFKLAFILSSAYQHGGDPYKALQFNDDLVALEAARGKAGFFEALIQMYLLDNPHRALLVLNPDQDMTERAEVAEKALLETIKAGLNADQTASILHDAKSLRDSQNTPSDLSSLPSLALSDVPMTFENVPHSLESVHGATVGLFPQPTNGLIYLDLQVDFSNIPERLKDLIPVFAFIAPKMGAGNHSYLEMASRIEAVTGGIAMGSAVRGSPTDASKFSQHFSISGKALARNTKAFFCVLTDLLTDLNIDRTHLKNLLGQFKASCESQVTNLGYIYVSRLAEAQTSAAGALRERLEGVTQVGLSKNLAALDDAGIISLIADLESLRELLFRNANLTACVTSEPAQLESIKLELAALIAKLPAATSPVLTSTGAAMARQACARTTAVPVAFDALVIPTVPYAHPDAAALSALGNYLNNRYTHAEIREKGGAYGGMASSDRENAVFAFMSYHDPHIVRTFQVFANAAKYMVETVIDNDGLTEAVLKACSEIDPLTSPDSKGRSQFFDTQAGFTLDLQAVFKKQLLGVTAGDLKRVAAQYLTHEGAMAVISNDEKIAIANAEMGNIFEVAVI